MSQGKEDPVKKAADWVSSLPDAPIVISDSDEEGASQSEAKKKSGDQPKDADESGDQSSGNSGDQKEEKKGERSSSSMII